MKGMSTVVGLSRLVRLWSFCLVRRNDSHPADYRVGKVEDEVEIGDEVIVSAGG